MKLRPGLYRLGRDIVNPRPDGRVRHNWLGRATWKKGDQFLLGAGSLFFPAITERNPGLLLLASAEEFVEGYAIVGVAPHSDDFQARVIHAELLPALVRVPATVRGTKKKGGARTKKMVRGERRKTT